ncbi:MAG TPA: xanthine dehydrogenase [Papillibacter sp.]|jgi:xanthine dehydrogenase accessory factor|nr:xanthine dehydrogenase [Papillibacter sp.]
MFDRSIYTRISEDIASGRRAAAVTQLGADKAVTKHYFSEKELYAQDGADEGSPLELARRAMQSGELELAKRSDGLLFAEPYVPPSRLIILGGGHIALPLAEFGAKCGFSVTVADDRPMFANRQRFPWADEVICEGFDRVFPKLGINRSAFVVIVTRGHRHDLDCLRAVLHLETAYIGMIGSKRRVRAAFEQMRAEGFPQEAVDRVHSPIGLKIGARTPEEIAVSILSEVIQSKRCRDEGSWPELGEAVLKELARKTDEPRALVTIISAKGSTPRDPGAKMIVWPDGRILGSIGGGCSESGVISAAYDVIKAGGYDIVDVDMTGDVAEEEGMVCGGVMQVAIEALI